MTRPFDPRAALRARALPTVFLACVLAVPAGAAPAAVPADGRVVAMQPDEVRADPFLTLGFHAMMIATLTRGAHLYVHAVNPASPSARNGLRSDDEIIRINGRPITIWTLLSLRKMFTGDLSPGATYPCVVVPYHGTVPHAVVLEPMPEPRHRWLPIEQVPANPSEPRDPMPAPRPDALTEANWRESGSATPQAALESLFSALGRGDVDRVASSLEVSGDVSGEWNGLFRSLPAAGRAYYRSPERMLAALVDQEGRPRWIRIRKATPLGADAASLETALQFWTDLDHDRSVSTYVFRRTPTGWKWAISSKSVRRYAEYYRGVPFELAAPGEVPAIAWFFRSS